MKTYFFSGGTVVVDGHNRTQCGTFTSADGTDAIDSYSQLVEDKASEFGEKFILIAFNRID